MFGFENCNHWFISPTRKIGWTGQITQNGMMYHFNITDMTFDINGTINGFGGDSIGSYNIIGKLGTDNAVEFYKNYSNGTKIQFQGDFCNNGLITGQWTSQQSDSGPFEIKLQNIERWGGTCYQGRKKKELQFDMNLDSGEVFGFGKDHNGVFHITGKSDRTDSGKFNFIKRYANGENNIAFIGTLSISGDRQILSGDFKELGNETSGKFELKLINSNNYYAADQSSIFNKSPARGNKTSDKLGDEFQTVVYKDQQYNQELEFEQSHDAFEQQKIEQSYGHEQSANIQNYSFAGQSQQQTYDLFTEYELQYSANIDKQRVEYAINSYEDGKKFDTNILVFFVELLRYDKAIDKLLTSLNKQNLIDFDYKCLGKIIVKIGYSHTKLNALRYLTPLLPKNTTPAMKGKIVDLLIFQKEKQEAISILGI